MASDNYIARGGSVATVTSPPWGRAKSVRTMVSWLGAIEPQAYMGGPRISPELWKILHEMAKRLDGIRGLSIADVQATVEATQTTLLEAQTIALQAASSASAANASLGVVKEVAVNAGLDGAEQIP